jgi:hypothetical protein
MGFPTQKPQNTRQLGNQLPPKDASSEKDGKVPAELLHGHPKFVYIYILCLVNAHADVCMYMFVLFDRMGMYTYQSDV